MQVNELEEHLVIARQVVIVRRRDKHGLLPLVITEWLKSVAIICELVTSDQLGAFDVRQEISRFIVNKPIAT